MMKLSQRDIENYWKTFNEEKEKLLKKQAKLPIEEKLRILDIMRKNRMAIKGGKR